MNETEIIALISKFQKRTLLNRGTMYRAPDVSHAQCFPIVHSIKKDLKNIIVLKLPLRVFSGNWRIHVVHGLIYVIKFDEQIYPV